MSRVSAIQINTKQGPIACTNPQLISAHTTISCAIIAGTGAGYHVGILTLKLTRITTQHLVIFPQVFFTRPPLS